jgi:nucleotide-binding universal stress UspA family protein
MQALDARVRIQLKNILFCTDFSPTAEGAFHYAAEFARHFGAKLHAIYVRNSDNYVIAFPEGGSIPPGFTLAQAREKLKNLLDPLADIDRGVLVKEENVWSALASVIENNEIDLIVAGTRGRTGVAKLVLASHAEEIFRRAPCPVLTVGPHSSAHLPNGSTIKEILYATDFSPESAAAAPFAISLAQEYQARLTLLHVIVDPRTGDLVQPREPVASSERFLRDLVPPEAGLWCEPRFLVEQGPAAETILDLARLRKVDLIVLGVRRPAGVLGVATHLPVATAHKVVSRADCPVLTARA